VIRSASVAVANEQAVLALPVASVFAAWQTRLRPGADTTIVRADLIDYESVIMLVLMARLVVEHAPASQAQT
jgi:hypothetical protein